MNLDLTSLNLGQLLATVGSLDLVPTDELEAALARHAKGDWGEIDRSERALNDMASLIEGHFYSVYRTVAGTRFSLFTDADRSFTALIIPP